MRLPCSLRLALLAAALQGGVCEDAVAFLQQSVGVHAASSLGWGFGIGEEVQVKFRGETRWVDCFVKGAGSLPDTYDVHVPLIGAVKDKTFRDVPSSMLRKAYKGYEINIESGETNASTWVPCLITAKNGNRYTAELLEMRPGLVVEGVLPELIREDHERSEKWGRVHTAIAENEANKANLFYMAQVKPNTALMQAAQQKQAKEQADRDFVSMQRYVWEEMARRTAKEAEEERKKDEKRDRKHLEQEAKKRRMEQAKKEADWAATEFNADSDPVAAMMVKARQLQEVAHEQDLKMKSKFEEEARAEREFQAEKKRQAEKRAREVEEHMALLRQQHQAKTQMKSTEADDSPRAQEAREKAKMFAAMELQQKKQVNMFREEFMQAEQEEDSKYKEEEARRQAQVMDRKQVAARKQLGNAMQAFNEDESAGKQETLQKLMAAVTAAADAKIEAETIDPARTYVIKEITAGARASLNRAMESQNTQEVQSILRSLPSKAQQIDRVWKGLQDTDEKMTMPRFQEYELKQLKDRIPELQKNEVKFAALRANIEVSKLSTERLRKAIEAAEKGGLPAEELEAAKAKLHDKETKPLLIKSIEDAKEAGDAGRLQAAIAEAEASGLVNGGVLHNARGALQKLQKQHEGSTAKALNVLAP